MNFFKIFKKKKTVSLKEFNEMRRFLLAQITQRDKTIEKLKEEKKIILNMAIKKNANKNW